MKKLRLTKKQVELNEKKQEVIDNMLKTRSFTLPYIHKDNIEEVYLLNN